MAPKPYGSGTLTEAGFFGMIRSCLRRLSLRWKPRGEYLRSVRRPYIGPDKRTKWEYPCIECKEWHAQKNIEVDHIIPAGKLNCFDDIGPFVRRLLVEREGYQVLCKACHKKKTQEQRQKNEV
jgi:5-methylcytosine-specific restriction endonuclease McrA